MSDLHAAMAKAGVPPGYYTNPLGHPEYLVSDEGQIWSLKKGISRRLSGCSAGEGYKAVTLDGRRKYIHQIVCEIFHGPRPSPSHQARHLNGDKLCNHPANLAWGTPKQNAADKVSCGTVSSGARNGMAKLTWSDVSAMRQLRATSEATFSEIGRAFGVSAMTALRAIKGESWK